jgi:hypothetical protein
LAHVKLSRGVPRFIPSGRAIKNLKNFPDLGSTSYAKGGPIHP